MRLWESIGRIPHEAVFVDNTHFDETNRVKVKVNIEGLLTRFL